MSTLSDADVLKLVARFTRNDNSPFLREETTLKIARAIEAAVLEGREPVAPLAMPGPTAPSAAEATRALEWLYHNPKADAYTEYTAIKRFIATASPTTSQAAA